MSEVLSERLRSWLISQRSERRETFLPAKTVSFLSGKGGVGKTTCSLLFALALGDLGKKVLYLDADANLSNGVIKLGLPLKNHLKLFLDQRSNFSPESFFRSLSLFENIHLLSGGNGELSFYTNEDELRDSLISLLLAIEAYYDVIVIDCAAGAGKEVLSLASYCDYRVVVVNDDKSSLTDSYSVIKILNLHYGVKNFYLLGNKFEKITGQKSFLSFFQGLAQTADAYLDTYLNPLGVLEREEFSSKSFDQEIRRKNSPLRMSSFKFTRRFSEEELGANSRHTMCSVSKTEGEGLCRHYLKN